jgi:acyl dehydratase
MNVFQDFDALEKAVGSHLGYSDWETITQDRVDRFADATGDHQWIHTDPIRAADGPFGSTIAHGYLTLALVPMLVSQIFAIEGVGMGLNYGSDATRFLAPAPVGSRIRAGAELIEVGLRSSGAKVVLRVTLELESGGRPVCVTQTISIFPR